MNLPQKRLLAAVACLFTVAIFLIDTYTSVDVAVAVLYGVVVIIAGGFLSRRGMLIVSAICVALTVLSYFVEHGLSPAGTPLGRCLMSLSAIAITTFLALKIQSASLTLRERAGLLDLTHDTIVARDMADRVTYWNAGAAELYGWASAEALGKSIFDLAPTRFPAPREEIVATLLRAGRWEGKLLRKTRDGAQLVVASRWRLQRDEQGRPIAILETGNDITEHERMEEALRRTQAELAQFMRATTLNELTASIAHEVNQPLGAIVTNGEACLRWLGREVPELDEARASVRSMIDDGVRASDVIKRLRALSKKSAPQRSRLDLGEMIDETFRLLQREALAHRVALRRELAPEASVVVGDRVQLQQVMINLITNGVQAMATVADRPRELRVFSRLQDRDHILVGVQDRGTGVDPRISERLFDPFVTTKSDGMGMGLAISRSIVEAHGGRLWASGEADCGATFQLALPVTTEAACGGEGADHDQAG